MPHERFIRSETSVFTISDDDVNGTVGKSTLSFGLQNENSKRLSNFEKEISQFSSTLMRWAMVMAEVVALAGRFRLYPRDKRYKQSPKTQKSFRAVSLAP